MAGKSALWEPYRDPGIQCRREQPLTEPPPPQRRRILWKLFLLFCVFSLIGFGLLSWYVTTDSFQQMARRRVVASGEKMTGGRVALGELHTIPFRLRVDARNLTIHGREASDQVPFLRVDRLQAEMKIISLLSTTIGLHSLVLEHPVVHIIDYPDGTTNAPVPQASLSSNRGPIEHLISLSVSHIAVQHGELLWEDRKVPFEFAARDVALLLNYSLLRRQYEAHGVARTVATRFQDYPSFVWHADASLILARGRADISSLTVASGKSEIPFAGRLPAALSQPPGKRSLSWRCGPRRTRVSGPAGPSPQRYRTVRGQRCLEPAEVLHPGNRAGQRDRMVER